MQSCSYVYSDLSLVSSDLDDELWLTCRSIQPYTSETSTSPRILCFSAVVDLHVLLALVRGYRIFGFTEPSYAAPPKRKSYY